MLILVELLTITVLTFYPKSLTTPTTSPRINLFIPQTSVVKHRICFRFHLQEQHKVQQEKAQLKKELEAELLTCQQNYQVMQQVKKAINLKLLIFCEFIYIR